MTIEDDFRSALDDAARTYGDDPTLQGTRLATAIAAVLPVDGASISIGSEGYRLPLGASDDESALAERMQFTAGEGPCLTALEEGTAVSAAQHDVSTRWPELADLWFTKTRFRSAMSHPLIRREVVRAAVNLFFVDDTGNERVDGADVATVAALAGRQLADVLGPELVDAPSPNARRRQRLWLMVGMAMDRWQLTGPDALARLRAQAYARGVDLEELADAVSADPAVLNDQP